ncbi:hypothetical protein [Proteus vulgaris]|uniref:phage tail fiber protein n=1 Tax=Proteus vulgaris TaxID=585 RepID=UPI001F494179|nr:hypothetical protein [Proteus vulgaris]WIF73569.1 hypothetical protein QN092_06750 [Proteus vulgaris]
MIYTTGTVNTVAGSAIVRGTGTKFKNNNPAINIGMTILIKSGNTNIPYMIKSVNSDTELVLAHPALATATNTTFSIHIAEPDNNSDAARTMVAINAYTQYFLDAMNTWMSETGQTKIEMPNGEIITLDSIKKMQGDIDGKVNKTGDVMPGPLITKGYLRSEGGEVNVTNDGAMASLMVQDGLPQLVSRIGSEKWIRNQLPTEIGKIMVVGDSGVGQAQPVINADTLLGNEFNRSNFGYTDGLFNYWYGVSVAWDAKEKSKAKMQILTGINNEDLYFRHANNALNAPLSFGRSYKMYSEKNTTTDPQGFIKKTSPIININSDGTFTTNDESEGATVTRVAKGEVCWVLMLTLTGVVLMVVLKFLSMLINSHLFGLTLKLIKTVLFSSKPITELTLMRLSLPIIKLMVTAMVILLIFLMVVLSLFVYRCQSNQSIT